MAVIFFCVEQDDETTWVLDQINEMQHADLTDPVRHDLTRPIAHRSNSTVTNHTEILDIRGVSVWRKNYKE